MKMTIEMPVVSGCSISLCAYNVDAMCHARAITVGDGNRPCCDTFLEAGKHTKETKRRAGVGACKVSACAHNSDYECTADMIEVGSGPGGTHCMTCTL